MASVVVLFVDMSRTTHIAAAQVSSPGATYRVDLAGRFNWFARNLAVLALLLIVIGPASSSYYVESSPFHTHVFLGDQADHSHGAMTVDHQHDVDDEDVISLADHSGAASGSIQVFVDLQSAISPAEMRAVDHVGPHLAYIDIHSTPLEQPPRYS